jgi:hypothetical protein
MVLIIRLSQRNHKVIVETRRGCWEESPLIGKQSPRWSQKMPTNLSLLPSHRQLRPIFCNRQLHPHWDRV